MRQEFSYCKILWHYQSKFFDLSCSPDSYLDNYVKNIHAVTPAKSEEFA